MGPKENHMIAVGLPLQNAPYAAISQPGNVGSALGLGKRAAHGCIGSDGSMVRSAGWLCVEPIVMLWCSP